MQKTYSKTVYLKTCKPNKLISKDTLTSNVKIILGRVIFLFPVIVIMSIIIF